MKFTKKNNFAGGTSLMGYVETNYDRLVAVFGEPTYLGRGDKVTAEWVLEFDDGTVATVYDWKEDETPMGQYEWHIGGHRRSAVDRVQECLAA